MLPKARTTEKAETRRRALRGTTGVSTAPLEPDLFKVKREEGGFTEGDKRKQPRPEQDLRRDDLKAPRTHKDRNSPRHPAPHVSPTPTRPSTATQFTCTCVTINVGVIARNRTTGSETDTYFVKRIKKKILFTVYFDPLLSLVNETQKPVL